MTALDLRPLSLGELLDRTFFLYRRNFLLFIGIAGIPYLFLLGMSLGPILVLVLAPVRLASSAMAAGAVVGIILLIASFLVAMLFSVGATVFAVAEIYSGHPATIRGSFRLVRGKVGTILGVMILSMLYVFGGFLLLIVPGIILMCRTPAATAAALIEDLGPVDAIRRSLDLTKGFAGRAFMIILLTAALNMGVAAVLQLPFFFLIAVSAKQPQLVILWTVLMQVGSVLGSVIVTPVSTIGFALYYYDLRVRKEAFDLQMMMQAIGGSPLPPPITGGVPSMFGRDAS